VSRVVAICRPEVAVGLRLAGIPVLEATSPSEVPDRIAGLTGLVLLQDDLHDRETDLEVPGGPVVVPFPGPRWRPGELDEHVLEILRRAIGYRVRLR